jgi:MtaA/CmuA family methyltransferase
MTSLERYRATLAGQPVDHLARVPILMQFAAEHIGSNYGAFAADHRVLTAANFACARDFGMDQLSAISDPYRETQGFGAVVGFRDKLGPYCKNPPLAADPDLDRLPRPDPLAAPRMRDRIDAIAIYQRDDHRRHSILGWVEGPAAEAADLRGVDNFFTDLFDDETYTGELMDRCLATALDFARAQIAAGADTIGIGDAVASQVSPDHYQRLILPREQALVAGIQAAGAAVRLHICGNITHLLPGIASLGVDILDVDHMVDLAAVRSALGPAAVIAGNLDPVAAVLRSEPAAIRRRVRDDYRRAGYPFLVNAGCEIPAGTPPENLRALCEPIAWESGD